MERLRRYESPNGFSVFAGKNASQNEFLTFELGHGDDMWFHARDCPGSHVVMQWKKGKRWTCTDLLFAARVAALHSQYKSAKTCAVTYCHVRDVVKPNRSNVGSVHICNASTIEVKL